MKHTLFLLLGTAIMIGAGCTKSHTTIPAPLPASEYPTYQFYSVVYNKTLNTTSLFSMLNLYNEHGPAVNPGYGDSALSANGQLIYSQNTVAFSGLPDLSIRFRRKGMDFYNPISLGQVSDISFPANTPTEISLSGTTVFTWDGPPLEPNEEAEIEFKTQSYGDQTSSVGLADNVVTIDERTRPSFGPGTCKMTLRRIRHLPLAQSDSTAGGEIKIKLEVVRDVMLK